MSEQLSMYFNTTGLKGEDLRQAMDRMKGQNRAILNFFKGNPGGYFTPFEVQDHANISAPITSVRRAINTLTEKGYLVKTKHMKPGAYGSLNHTWKYNR